MATARASWLLLSLLVLSLAHGEDRNTTIELGGVRKVKATIVESEADVEVEVSLIPVSCFDVVLNKQLTHEKAQSYVKQALVRLFADRQQRISTIGQSVTVRSVVMNSRYVLVVRMPRKDIKTTPLSAPARQVPELAKEPQTERSLLKAKDDYLDTLKSVVRNVAESAPPPPKVQDDLRKFYEAISDAEETAVVRFAALAKEVRNDRWLLANERDDISEAITLEEARSIEQLHQLVTEGERNAR